MVKLFGFTFLILMIVGLPQLAAAGLCINEIMADPSSDWDGDGIYNYRDDEWVELYNAGPGHIELSEYSLSDDTGLWTYGFEPGEGLSVGEAIVIYGSQSLLWQQANGVSSYGFKMSNDGDAVVLWQIASSDTVLVDTHTFVSHEADDDRSSGRNPDGTGDWEIFDALNNYSGSNPPFGNNLPPTPGYPNMDTEPPVPVNHQTWGAMKSLFQVK